MIEQICLCGGNTSFRAFLTWQADQKLKIFPYVAGIPER